MLVNLTRKQVLDIAVAVRDIEAALFTPAFTERQRALAKEALGMAAQLVRDCKARSGLGGWTNPFETANEIDVIASILKGDAKAPRCSAPDPTSLRVDPAEPVVADAEQVREAVRLICDAVGCKFSNGWMFVAAEQILAFAARRYAGMATEERERCERLRLEGGDMQRNYYGGGIDVADRLAARIFGEKPE